MINTAGLVKSHEKCMCSNERKVCWIWILFLFSLFVLLLKLNTSTMLIQLVRSLQFLFGTGIIDSISKQHVLLIQNIINSPKLLCLPIETVIPTRSSAAINDGMKYFFDQVSTKLIGKSAGLY